MRSDAGLESGAAEAVDVHVDDAAQLSDEELDVDASAAVYLGRVLPRQDGDSHSRSP
jgi:hypothetical protein